MNPSSRLPPAPPGFHPYLPSALPTLPSRKTRENHPGEEYRPRGFLLLTVKRGARLDYTNYNDLSIAARVPRNYVTGSAINHIKLWRPYEERAINTTVEINRENQGKKAGDERPESGPTGGEGETQGAQGA